ncbi:MAG: response regulator transcription factor, partial [Actinobacteria bacterium]|nr:response regulator transcription factor [Actinomycetota bacterium]
MRVVVAEDQALMREGLVLLLEQDGAEVVGRAADAPDLLRKVGAHRPDLVVADIRMPPRNADDGLQAALRIRAEHPETAVLLLSQHVQRSYATELVEQGTVAVGYLLKDRVADVASFLAD